MIKYGYLLFVSAIFTLGNICAQEVKTTEKNSYKKRVLEATEIDVLSSYYTQDGDNSAVTGGKGTEDLTDVTGAIIVSIPMNDDDVLTIDAGISAYTSASSSNINPFGEDKITPFQATSGASSGDLWVNLSGNYAHYSDDRNQIWSGKLSFSREFDYTSIGVGGAYTRLFNEKNTELSVHGSVYFDTWKGLYPEELKPFAEGEDGLSNGLFSKYTITGNTNYAPQFAEVGSKGRNSYSLGASFAQILSKNLQGVLVFDFVRQDGLLSTPFQRIYFADVADSYISDFHLADGIEQLPDSRTKFAIGGRLNWFLNEMFVVRTFYRYYFDNWGVKSHTASVEVPVKISKKITLYPSYRFYKQGKADYFYPYNMALSTSKYYTSDNDLSEYDSNQFGLGISYTDIFTKAHIWKFGIKSIDLKFYKYDRNTSFSSNMLTAGVKFVLDN